MNRTTSVSWFVLNNQPKENTALKHVVKKTRTSSDCEKESVSLVWERKQCPRIW